MRDHPEAASQKIRFERSTEGDLVTPLIESHAVRINVPRSNGGISVGTITWYNTRTDVVRVTFVHDDKISWKNLEGEDFRKANPDLIFDIEDHPNETTSGPGENPDLVLILGKPRDGISKIVNLPRVSFTKESPDMIGVATHFNEQTGMVTLFCVQGDGGTESTPECSLQQIQELNPGLTIRKLGEAAPGSTPVSPENAPSSVPQTLVNTVRSWIGYLTGKR